MTKGYVPVDSRTFLGFGFVADTKKVKRAERAWIEENPDTPAPWLTQAERTRWFQARAKNEQSREDEYSTFEDWNADLTLEQRVEMLDAVCRVMWRRLRELKP